MPDRYRKGAHTIYDIKYHFVWKTKYGYRVLKGNVRANHTHLLVSCPSDIAPSKIAQYLKGKSSYRLQREFRELQKRYWGRHLWARGYFCAHIPHPLSRRIDFFKRRS